MKLLNTIMNAVEVIGFVIFISFIIVAFGISKALFETEEDRQRQLELEELRDPYGGAI